jgi:HNH endonuclease
MRKRTPPIDRFRPKVDRHGPVPEDNPELGPCALWTGVQMGGQPGDRYGGFWDGDKKVYAHRWIFEYYHGPIPKGLEPDHLCFRRLCVKAIADDLGPAHIVGPLTRRENVLRGNSVGARNARKTHCAQGHPFSPENTFVSKGVRYCRECNRLKKSAQHRQRIRRVRPERPQVGPPNEAKTHCPAGHPYSGANLRIDTNGARRCRMCESEHNRNRRRK